jgi:uncharacterized membrane protein (GlpM family)
LIELLITWLIFGVCYYVITLIPLPPPFAMIAQLILAVILLLVLLSYLLPLVRVRLP